MLNDIEIPNLPGYVSIKEAADMLGVSDKRVYQYVRAGRLPAQRIGHILILPIEEVRHFKPSPTGRLRTKAPSWRIYRSRGMLLITDIHVRVRDGQQARLIEKLKAIEELDRYTFPGTVERFIANGDADLKTIQVLLIWKTTEMPDEATRTHDFVMFQKEMADVLDWETAQINTNEVIIQT